MNDVNYVKGGLLQRPLVVMVLACLALSALTPVMASVKSDATSAPIGRMPVADNVAIDNPAPILGDTLNVTYDYSDEDGDAEATPDIKWLYNGAPVAGQTGSDYTPVLDINTGTGNACGDFQVAAEVIPKSLTGDPLAGNTKQSAPVTVALPVIPGFTFPDTVRRNWSDADAFCKAQGMQLPTRADLQGVFNGYTIGGTNHQMAERYGWPLNGGRCGGDTTGYWTGDGNSSSSFAFVMSNGSGGMTPGNIAMHVTCVPGPGPAQLPTAVTLTHPSSGSLDLNGANFAGRPVVTVDEITANLTFVPDTQTDLSNYRFEWFAGGVSTGVVNDGDNKFTPRAVDQGKPIKVVVTLKP